MKRRELFSFAIRMPLLMASGGIASLAAVAEKLYAPKPSYLKIIESLRQVQTKMFEDYKMDSPELLKLKNNLVVAIKQVNAGDKISTKFE